MQSLKIGIIAHIKYPLKQPFVGGLECFTHMLARGLIAKGHTVTVFAAAGSDTIIHPSIIASPTADEFAQPNPPSYEIAALELTMYREYCAYNKLMHDLAQSDFDLIHNNCLHHLAIDFCETLPMPMVTTLHTPPLAWLAAAFTSRPAKNHFIVTISEYMKRLWQPIIASDAVILNGIDLENFKFEAKKENYAVWFGRITPEKGTHLAIEAANKANIKLQIAGAIYDHAYFKKAIQPKLNDKITYIGHLEHQQLSRIIAKAELSLCTPCWDEPYGLVAAESLACGTPVAAFKRGAMPEILDSKSGALAEPNNADALAIAIKKVGNLQPYDCRKRAEEIASAETMLHKYEELYRKALAT